MAVESGWTLYAFGLSQAISDHDGQGFRSGRIDEMS